MATRLTSVIDIDENIGKLKILYNFITKTMTGYVESIEVKKKYNIYI